jgi:probable H4MPT-linked C1 transfer pathway protein
MFDPTDAPPKDGIARPVQAERAEAGSVEDEARRASRFHATNDRRSRVLGLDIGGANIKLATDLGQTAAAFFPMWQRPDKLADALIAIAGPFASCDRWAVTMTGEMADIFRDRQVGVAAIARQTVQAAAQVGCKDVRFYCVDGHFGSLDDTLADPDRVASANWHAMALWVARQLDAPALLVDVGSTTTDIIPISPETVATKSKTDFDRLVAGELVYIGGGRTPVCALVSQLPYRDKIVPVMREVFATTDDCALVLGWAEESASDRMTCDGQPRTVNASINRLARMIGLDHRSVTLADARKIAQATVAAAASMITAAIDRQAAVYRGRWVLAGHTAEYFLSSQTDAEMNSTTKNPLRIERLADRLGRDGARVGPALACARLLADSLR